MAPIGVLIVEDHRMVAEGLAAVLAEEPTIEVVGLAGTLAEALAIVEGRSPDVVLMDYRLPDGDGAEGTRLIRARHPETEVVMLTAVGTTSIMAEAMAAGCTGFLTKDRGIDDVVAAVTAAAGGAALVSREALADLVPRLPRALPVGEQEAREAELTAREMQVLGLLAQGASANHVAERLQLSTHTVRNHVRHILNKLGAHSKLEAVAYAVRDGIISLERL